jgi:DNA-binding transcriptional regulator YiaG
MDIGVEHLKRIFLEEMRSEAGDTIAFVFEGKAIVRTDQIITLSTKTTGRSKEAQAEALIEKLRQHMEKRNLPESAVSTALGVSQANLSHWLSGRNRPNRAMLKKLQSYLNPK